MTQRFAQKSNLPVAIGFGGLILISQLMIFNMGYQVPWYFLTILIVLCGLIIWGMVANDILLEEDRVVIMSGPFKNTIPFSSINSLSVRNPGLFNKLKTETPVIINYGKGKRFELKPKDRTAFLSALTRQIPPLDIPEELKV